jgi:hypothetical protein
MGFSLEIEFMGKPATIHVDTIEELRDLIGYGNVVKTRTIATKRIAKRRGPKGRGPNAATRSNKAAKTKAKTGSRGWGPDVFEMAREKNIRTSEARSIIAKQKQAAKKKGVTKKAGAA